MANDWVFIGITIVGQYKYKEGYLYQFDPGCLRVAQNDLINGRLSAWFSASLNDSSNTHSVQLSNGYFSLQY
jgi:hypothetical protein